MREHMLDLGVSTGMYTIRMVARMEADTAYSSADKMNTKHKDAMRVQSNTGKHCTYPLAVEHNSTSEGIASLCARINSGTYVYVYT